MNTQVIHTSYTPKAGYVWRQRYASNTISIALQTQDAPAATQRSALMSIRFMQLQQLAVPFSAIREALKAYRNEIVMQDKVNMMASPEALQSVQTVSQRLKRSL